jgi:molybdopterin synthase catalytic subunit/molybdopterin converting factor small subunit
MKVSVRLFAVLRERAGRATVEVELADGATVRDAIAALPVAQGIPVVMAVNREVAAEDVVLQPGDELALIPPVSGGAIHTDPLSVDALLERVRDPRAGAVVTFSGVTREVDFLDYEAYAEMAAEQIEVIVTDAIERHGLCKAAADHRIGRVELGEPSVVVAASAPHREAAFAGAREIIDEIKARVPIWKREEGEWIHPA